MEPASLPVTKGRGSIENPEVHENVPGHVIPIRRAEFDDFDNEAEKFLAGETPEPEFIGFRLKQGVYGQRQPDVQMIRVKLPMGGITPEQMDALRRRHREVRAAEQGPHHDAPEHPDPPHAAARRRAAIRELSDAGISSREGCGNTVRNVTGDPWAGVADEEPFDPTPYAGAYVRYFVRHPTTQLMPRKVKTAFNGAPADRALTGIHDIAFIAARRGRRRAASRSASAAARRSCRASRRRSYEFVGADDGEYLEGRRGRLPHLRPPGLAARQPRPRPPEGLRRQVRHRGAAPPGRGGAAGRLGRRARLLRRAAPVRRRRGGQRARRARTTTAPPTATCRSSSASRASTVQPAAAGRLRRPSTCTSRAAT